MRLLLVLLAMLSLVLCAPIGCDTFKAHPVVETAGFIVDSLGDSVHLNLILHTMGDAEIVQVSFLIGTTPDCSEYETDPTSLFAASDLWVPSYPMELHSGTKYYYKAKAKPILGTVYGEVESFTIGGTEPTNSVGELSVVTYEAADVDQESATLRGELVSLDMASSVTVSFMWGTTDYLISNETIGEAMTTAGSFSFNLTGLDAKTTYYFRARAVGSTAVWGGLKSFTTGSATGDVFVMSSTILDHSHTVTIEGADIQTPPSTATYRTSGAYCSDLPDPVHRHKVELSGQQLETLKNGGVVTVTTSEFLEGISGQPYIPQTGAHTHTFTIRK